MNKLIVLCFVIVYLPLFANARECSVFEIKCGNICVDVKNWEVCQCCSEIIICCTTNSDCDENIRFVSKDKSYHGMQNVMGYVFKELDMFIQPVQILQHAMKNMIQSTCVMD